jgi:hypothetical protein
MPGGAFRAFRQAFVTHTREKQDLRLDWSFVLAAWPPRETVRECDDYCHSRLHALPETDELRNLTLPAYAGQRVL